MTFCLKTARLLLRQFKTSDLDSFFAYRNDPEVAKYQGWSAPYSRAKAVAFVREMSTAVPEPDRWLQVALELSSSAEMIGDVAFSIRKDDERQATIGYSLARPFWGQGFAFEAVSGLLGYLFDEMKLHRVTAELDIRNVSSWKLLDRLGFRREAHLVEHAYYNGAYVSEYHYAMLGREWQERLSSSGAEAQVT
jgi:RimJ/RimL family protein N-acetyltransferase